MARRGTTLRDIRAGLWGVVAIAALAGPFLHHAWKDRRA